MVLTRHILWLCAPLLATLHSAPAHAAQTAIVSGAPPLFDGPGGDYPATGQRLPPGATVTLERCSSDLVSGSAAAGAVAPAPGAGGWCLVRGAGWVAAGALVNISADPASLLPGGDFRDPLQDAAPAWDDFAEPDD